MICMHATVFESGVNDSVIDLYTVVILIIWSGSRRQLTSKGRPSGKSLSF